ncbi:MAG: hypothetical protein KDD56_07665 [Bdellovibrionales bacterium]|nr:hypothetical protein [Bdellovibrionales bacterium]
MANAASATAAKLIKEASVIDTRSENDTIRLWEGYREQALLWRALTLVQIPVTFIALILALVLWYGREITLNVPAKPLPGIYAAHEIPDTEFIDAATEFVNLVASYQPAVAKRQFLEAQKMLVEPMLTKFNSDMFGVELSTIENTERTQMFFTDPTKTSIERVNNDVIVTMSGERLKIIAGRELPSSPTKFTVVLTTIPKNALNPFGIVIKSVSVKRIES